MNRATIAPVDWIAALIGPLSPCVLDNLVFLRDNDFQAPYISSSTAFEETDGGLKELWPCTAGSTKGPSCDTSLGGDGFLFQGSMKIMSIYWIQPLKQEYEEKKSAMGSTLGSVESRHGTLYLCHGSFVNA